MKIFWGRQRNISCVHAKCNLQYAKCERSVQSRISWTTSSSSLAQVFNTSIALPAMLVSAHALEDEIHGARNSTSSLGMSQYLCWYIFSLSGERAPIGKDRSLKDLGFSKSRLSDE